MKYKFHYYDLIPIAMTLMILFLWVIPQYECFKRELYWNDRGLFIDIWEQKYPWECIYGEIPNES